MAVVVVLNNGGKGYLTGLWAAATNYVGWGTGATGATAAGTVISTESSDEARVASTNTQQTTTTTNDTFRAIGQLTCAVGGKTITNAGLFTASSAGTLLMWVTGYSDVLAIGDAVQYTFTYQF